MFFLKSTHKFVIAIPIILFILWGCASTAGKHVEIVYPKNDKFAGWPDAQLESRFREYWFDRFNGRTKEAYQMETPYFREMISIEKYENVVKRAVLNKLIDIEVTDMVKETDSLVRLSCVIHTQPLTGGDQVGTQIFDRWLLMGGRWYHVLKDRILLP